VKLVADILFVAEFSLLHVLTMLFTAFPAEFVCPTRHRFTKLAGQYWNASFPTVVIWSDKVIVVSALQSGKHRAPGIVVNAGNDTDESAVQPLKHSLHCIAVSAGSDMVVSEVQQ
jgi:hypothetical protein